LRNNTQISKYKVIPNVTNTFLSINIKECGIDACKSDNLLHRKFPNLFAKSLQIVLKRLESEQTNSKPNKSEVLYTCDPMWPETPPTSLISQKSTYEEPPVADSADALNLAATTAVDTAGQRASETVNETSDTIISSKPPPNEESSTPSNSNLLVSDPPHKITAFDISKLKSKLKNVKYPECFTAQTQTDNTLIDKTDDELNTVKQSDSPCTESLKCVDTVLLSQEDRDMDTQTCCANELDPNLPTPITDATTEEVTLNIGSLREKDSVSVSHLRI